MSVRWHEAFCLDSARRRFEFTDHFLGDSLRDLWTNTLGGGGTGAVVDGVDGGVFRLGTPTASDSSQLTWGNIRSLLVSKKATIETRVRANGGVTDTHRYFGSLQFDLTNKVLFYHNTDSVNINILSRNGGATVAFDSGFDIDDQWHIYRIE